MKHTPAELLMMGEILPSLIHRQRAARDEKTTETVTERRYEETESEQTRQPRTQTYNQETVVQYRPIQIFFKKISSKHIKNSVVFKPSFSFFSPPYFCIFVNSSIFLAALF